jgi:uncharacterized membrane protein
MSSVVVDIVAFLISLGLIVLLDYLFLKKIAHKIYIKEMGALSEEAPEMFHPRTGTSFLIYILLAAGTIALVARDIATQNLLQSFLSGALFGFVVYTVYDLMNYAILTKWSFKMSIIDIAWGTFLCGFISVIMKLLL